MTDTITLPREVVFRAVKALTPMAYDTWPRERQEIVTALRTHLAAEQPKHPGYVIGSHWLETAYSRVCAGEAEADVLRDCGWERVDDIEALRRDAERYRWLTSRARKDTAYDRYGNGALWTIGFFADDGRHALDAAIDAAMKEGKR